MKNLYTLLLASLLTTSLYAQIEATTKDGKRVLLLSDNTWKYAAEKPKPAVVDISADAETLAKMDCSAFIVQNEDKMTGRKRLSMKDQVIASQDGKRGIGFIVMQSDGDPILSLLAIGKGCIEEKAKINVLFSDESRLEIISNSDFNCKGSVPVYFGSLFGHREELRQLKTKDIQTIRVWTSDGYIQEDVKPADAIRIRKSLSCLSQ